MTISLVKGLVLYKSDGTVITIVQPAGDGNKFICNVLTIKSGKIETKQKIMYAYDLLKLSKEPFK